MHWIWRALVAGLLLGGAIFWVPAMSTNAATPFGNATNLAVYGPAAQDNDEDDNDEDNDQADDNNDNDDGNNNDNDTAGDNGNTNGNANDNDDPAPTPTPTPVPGSPVSQGNGEIITNGDLQIELFRSRVDPIVNNSFQIGVIGSGTPIERIWWWADNPGGNGGDDFGHAGEVGQDCGGASPCSGNWTIVGRNVGWYTIHAKVRATDGREVQTDWHFLVQSGG